MKADEPLISAKELPYRSRFPLADHGSMSDSAICTKPLARQGMPLWHLDRVCDHPQRQVSIRKAR